MEFVSALGIVAPLLACRQALPPQEVASEASAADFEAVAWPLEAFTAVQSDGPAGVVA